ncbi:MAG: SRPBCC family protein [Chrysiogenetes bacterium]|nr:SRPBCC family protein [Chrysiogenetes bacterium]
MPIFENEMINQTIEIDAPAAEVFALLKDIDNWSSWVRGVSKSYAISSGDWRVGYKIAFRTNMAPLTLAPLTIQEYEEGRVMEWGVRTPVFTMGHRFELTDLGSGRCRLLQREYSHGLLGYLTKPANGLIFKFDSAWAEDLLAYFGAKSRAA